MATIDDVLGRAPVAIAAARDETDGVPDEIISAIERQLVQLRSAR